MPFLAQVQYQCRRRKMREDGTFHPTAAFSTGHRNGIANNAFGNVHFHDRQWRRITTHNLLVPAFLERYSKPLDRFPIKGEWIVYEPSAVSPVHGPSLEAAHWCTLRSYQIAIGKTISLLSWRHQPEIRAIVEELLRRRSDPAQYVGLSELKEYRARLRRLGAENDYIRAQLLHFVRGLDPIEATAYSL